MATYSFGDNILVLNHPALGQLTVTGEGVGSIQVNMTNDVSAHDVAADGRVMVSRIRTGNGTLALALQQDSYAVDWLNKWYNYIDRANSDQWARMTAVLRNAASGKTEMVASGISPQKRADRSYQAQGQQQTWNLMAADIQQY